MKAMQTISALLSLIITMPIWFYLLYQVLVRVQATELMFFLFWIYFPVVMLTGILSNIAKSGK
jgi:hypothetical protein